MQSCWSQLATAAPVTAFDGLCERASVAALHAALQLCGQASCLSCVSVQSSRQPSGSSFVQMDEDEEATLRLEIEAELQAKWMTLDATTLAHVRGPCRCSAT